MGGTMPETPGTPGSKNTKKSAKLRFFVQVVVFIGVIEYFGYRVIGPSLKEHMELQDAHNDKTGALDLPTSSGGSDPSGPDPATLEERLKTAEKLEHMGVNRSEIDVDTLPPWSQILDNFNPNSRDDEPVILGLEYCEDFRKSKDPKLVAVGSAGLFSTGTNLLHGLLNKNCKGPLGRIGYRSKFPLMQVPWGKHNPSDARFHHQVKNPTVKDRESVLPVVHIRHPYTWMTAMCGHPYSARWYHDRDTCDQTLSLENPVRSVAWGFKQYNETHNVTNSYKNLADMWLTWNKPYFLDDRYNQTPRLMIRHEDMVFRPQKVVREICTCVGGTKMDPETDWEAPGGFLYKTETANPGPAHGKQGRTGLHSAILKYGQPLMNFYHHFNGSDRRIAKQVFQGEADPELRKIFETFQYKLFDDVNEPSAKDYQQLHASKKVVDQILTGEQKIIKDRIAARKGANGPPAKKTKGAAKTAKGAAGVKKVVKGARRRLSQRVA